MTLQVKKLREGALVPRRATEGSAGYDLHACLDGPLEILPGETRTVPTGIAIALPGPGCAAFVYARSGLGIKHGIVPGNCVGVIDSDYRGELLVGLHNHSAKPFTIRPGDRVAQIIIAPVLCPVLIECDELDDTARGAGGFGSTGVGNADRKAGDGAY